MATTVVKHPVVKSNHDIALPIGSFESYNFNTKPASHGKSQGHHTGESAKDTQGLIEAAAPAPYPGYTHFISPVLLLAAWQLIAHFQLIAPEVLVPPIGVWHAFWEVVESGELPVHLGNTLWRLLVGFSIGASIGLVLGSAMGASRHVQAYVNPLFQFIRPLPTVALIPAFVMFFGVGETIKLVLVAKATALLVTLATFEAVKGIPRTWLEVAAVYKTPPIVLLLRVILPATVPPVLTGLRLALGRSWMVLVAAELLVSENGLGQMMEHGRQMFRLDIVMVCVVLTGVIGWTLDKAMRALEWKLVRWQHR